MSKKLTKGVSAHLINNSVSTTTSSSTGSDDPSAASSSSPTLQSNYQLLGKPSTLLSNPPSILTDGQHLPTLIVFDLDYTLWPFWVDTEVVPPIKSSGGPSHHAVAVDKVDATFAFYADVPQLLYALRRSEVKLAVASRSHAPDLARDMLKILHVPPWSPSEGGPLPQGGGGGGSAAPIISSSRGEKPRRALEFFDGGMEIYPTTKIRHFEAIQRRTGVAYSDMLFFDDEARNREVEQVLGVLFCYVGGGMNWQELESGVWEWRKRRRFNRGGRDD